MRKLKRWIIDNKTHEESNTFLLTIICHGNKHGHLLDRSKSKAWDTEDFIGDLSEVETLLGKPKILIIQACRGGKSIFVNNVFCLHSQEYIFTTFQDKYKSVERFPRIHKERVSLLRLDHFNE